MESAPVHIRTGKIMGETMNRTRVIVVTTVAVFVIFCILAVVFFRGIPPWPVWLWFTVSHLFFCIVIARVKPYRGPYTTPMPNYELEKRRP